MGEHDGRGPVAGLTAPGVSSAVVPVRVRFPRRAGEGRLAEVLGQRPVGDVLHDTDVHAAVGVDVSQLGRRTACTSVYEAGPLNGRRAAVRSCRSVGWVRTAGAGIPLVGRGLRLPLRAGRVLSCGESRSACAVVGVVGQPVRLFDGQAR